MPQPRPRHGAAPPRGLRATLLWPLAALLLVGLVGAGTLRGTPLPDDGTLAGPGYLLLRGGGPDPLTPAGLAARHTAAYAQVTGAFQRHTSLHGAERELLLAVLLVTPVLLWRTARRLDVPDAGCAAAVLALGAVPALAPLHAAPTPAAFGAGWLLLAGWLATRVGAGALPAAVAGGLAALAAVPAVLLAPDALLLLVAGATAAAAARAGSAARRTGVALAGLLVLAGTRVLVGRWDPEPADPRGGGGGGGRGPRGGGGAGGGWPAGAGPGAGGGGGAGGPADPGGGGAARPGLAVLSVVLVVGGLLGAWRPPRFRAPAVALTATTV